MARFVKVGSIAFNQEAIAAVRHHSSTGVTHVELLSGAVHDLDGYEAAAFGNWLGRHIKGWGADAVEDYASDLADEARLMDELRQQDEGI